MKRLLYVFVFALAIFNLGSVLAGCTDYDAYPQDSYAVASYVSSDGGVFNDTCVDDTKLKEWRCINGKEDYVMTTCSLSCSEGACVTGCIDTDSSEENPEGKDIYVKGTVKTSNGYGGTDYCFLEEYGDPAVGNCFEENNCRHYEAYCKDDDTRGWINTKCEYGCSEGACVEPPKEETEGQTIKVEGFMAIKWACQDGSEDSKDLDPDCRSEEGWKEYAGEECSSGLAGITTFKPCTYEEEIVKVIPDKIKEPVPELYDAPSNGECQGCETEEGECLNIGERTEKSYCSIEGLVVQISEGGTCDNDFECQSEYCAGGQCVSGNFIQQIINWFNNLFSRG